MGYNGKPRKTCADDGCAEPVGRATWCDEHREIPSKSRNDRGAALDRYWLTQRQRALDASRGRCTRCGSAATTWNTGLTGQPVARCRSCALVDLAAATSRTTRTTTRTTTRNEMTVTRGRDRTSSPGPVAATVKRSEDHRRICEPGLIR